MIAHSCASAVSGAHKPKRASSPLSRERTLKGPHAGKGIWIVLLGVWIAAAGLPDEFGFKVVEDPVHVHDLQATILHLLGLDHEKLTFRYSGRDFRLTDVGGRIVKDILA